MLRSCTFWFLYPGSLSYSHVGSSSPRRRYTKKRWTTIPRRLYYSPHDFQIQVMRENSFPFQAVQILAQLEIFYLPFVLFTARKSLFCIILSYILLSFVVNQLYLLIFIGLSPFSSPQKWKEWKKEARKVTCDNINKIATDTKARLIILIQRLQPFHAYL